MELILQEDEIPPELMDCFEEVDFNMPTSVFNMSSESYRGAHFATFPSELARRCLVPSLSAGGCCPECGSQYAPRVSKERVATRPGTNTKVPGKNSRMFQERDPSHPGTYKHDRAYEEGSAGGNHPTEFGNRDPERHVAVSRVEGHYPTCGCHVGLSADDMQMIGSPTGSRIAPDPSLETGRAGFNRPRGDNEGTDGMTRYEQRQYAAQLKESPNKMAMRAEAGERFDHYVRTDKSGARPIPRALLETWIDRGWLIRVDFPKSREPESPVPPIVLDPFTGSGTTIQVARHMGFRAIGFEVNPAYIELAKERIVKVPRCFMPKNAAKKPLPPNSNQSLLF